MRSRSARSRFRPSAILLLAIGVLAPSIAAVAEAPDRGKLLVAARSLRDPNFRETVVLLLGYGPEGAMGLVLNRAGDALVGDVLEGVSDVATSEDRMFWGGPVTEGEVFVLLRAAEPPDGASRVFADIHATRSVELLRRLLVEHGATPFRVFVGYAGWGAGQLDGEIERGDWRVMRADPALVLDSEPDGLWRRLAPKDPTEVALAR